MEKWGIEIEESATHMVRVLHNLSSLGEPQQSSVEPIEEREGERGYG